MRVVDSDFRRYYENQLINMRLAGFEVFFGVFFGIAVCLPLTFFIGNLIVLFTIGFDQNLIKNPTYMLMFNLALLDLCISTFFHTFANVGK